MPHWVLIEEGRYQAEAAFLLARGFKAIALDHAIFEVYLDGGKERRVRGHAMVANLLMVELSEDDDEFDLLVDLGGEFKYLLRAPSISAGKAFSPDVKSLLHFGAREPLQKLSGGEFFEIRSKLVLIDLQAG
jgi:hypothetical protein